MRKGVPQQEDVQTSSTPVKLEGVSKHCFEGGEREADLAVRLVKQSVLSTEEVKEEWLFGKLYEATVKYDLMLGQA